MVPKMVAIYGALYFFEWPKGPNLPISSYLYSPRFSVPKRKHKKKTGKKAPSRPKT